jgi:putative spermidine/putrescine transport system permease protein
MTLAADHLSNDFNTHFWGARAARPRASRFSWAWVVLLPFFAFAVAFLLLPSASIVVRSFQGTRSEFTLANIEQVFARPDLLRAYETSLLLSLVTALSGGLSGFLLCYAVSLGGLPRSLRGAVLTFSGVASNFAGVPLAFAFIATMGQTGLVTRLLNAVLNTNIYHAGFSIYNFWGLSIVYTYFQLPLMVLIIAPALDGLRREWREAAEGLGADTRQYWQRVALPILLPALLSTMVLLFGNSFGAYATAYAFAGSQINVVPIVIGANIRGNVLYDPGLGNALALGMIVIMAACVTVYSRLQRRSELWLR